MGVLYLSAKCGEIMANLGTVEMFFKVRIDDFKKKIETVGKDLDGVGKRMEKFGKKASTFLTLPLVGVGTAMLLSASEAEEAGSKFDAVFKDLAKPTREWAEETAKALSRSRFELEDFLATLQDTFVPLGFARDTAADMSKEVTKLAIDLASFNNIAEPDVIRDLQSALVGNTETVRKYGIIITQATLNQELLNMGVRGGVKAATEAQKAQARLNIILDSTTDAQGDAERTAGSFANQLKALQADIKEVAILLGQELIPFAKELIEVIRPILRGFADLDKGTKRLIVIFGGIATALGPVITSLTAMSKVLPIVSRLILGLATPTGFIIGTLGLLGIAFAKLKEEQEEFVNANKQTVTSLGESAEEMRTSMLGTMEVKERLEELKDANISAEEKVRRLKEVFGDMKRINPDLVKGYDLQALSIENVDDWTEEAINTNERYIQSLIETAKVQLRTATANANALGINRVELQKQAKALLGNQSTLRRNIETAKMATGSWLSQSESVINATLALEKNKRQLQEILKDLRENGEQTSESAKQMEIFRAAVEENEEALRKLGQSAGNAGDKVTGYGDKQKGAGEQTENTTQSILKQADILDQWATRAEVLRGELELWRKKNRVAEGSVEDLRKKSEELPKIQRKVAFRIDELKKRLDKLARAGKADTVLFGQLSKELVRAQIEYTDLAIEIEGTESALKKSTKPENMKRWEQITENVSKLVEDVPKVADAIEKTKAPAVTFEKAVTAMGEAVAMGEGIPPVAVGAPAIGRAVAVAPGAPPVPAEAPPGGVVININIAEMIIREEADITKIANELFKLEQEELRAQGRSV
jgi:TP901 family phage tail tape measure protein